MARNIEIKARITSIEVMAARAAAIADDGPTEIDQDDTFYACPRGRLKLRELSPREGQLIFYERPDDPAPKESAFIIAPTSAPAAMREILSRACRDVGRVRKHRTLYLVGRTRVHLDRVEGLGAFLELEVVLAEGEPSEDGIAEAHALMTALGVRPDQLVAGAYVDLLAARCERRT